MIKDEYKQLYEQVCEQYDVLAKELEATNRQVEILSDALAESRREVAAKDEALNMAFDLAIMHHTDDGYSELRQKLRHAIKQALAAPNVQEPVAWMYQCTADNSGPVLLQHRTNWAESGTGLWVETPLYTTPPAAEWQKIECPICGDMAVATDIPAAQPAPVEPLEYWNAVEGWVKIDEVREHFDSVGCGTIYKTAGDGRVPLTSAQRQWVGLTEDEVDEIFNNWPTCNLDHFEFGQIVEAKIFEKNKAIAVVIPDVLNPKDENPAYAAGWNDCRAEMLKGGTE